MGLTNNSLLLEQLFFPLLNFSLSFFYFPSLSFVPYFFFFFFFMCSLFFLFLSFVKKNLKGKKTKLVLFVCSLCLVQSIEL